MDLSETPAGAAEEGRSTVRLHQGEPASSMAGSVAPAPIDVQQLADRVYRLMLAEVRLARARGEPADEPRRG
jgi:hypothetical protein